jgi:hypothetical protein
VGDPADRRDRGRGPPRPPGTGPCQFDDADALVDGLTERGLLRDGALTDEGRALIAGVRERTTIRTGTLWDDLPEADVAATERVLNELLERARSLLARA